MKTVILTSAKNDLHQLRSYLLKNFSPDVWQTTYAKLKESIRNLSAFPCLGAVTPELADIHIHQYRQLICGMNRIIYEVRGDTLYVHVIVDTRRDLSALLLRRLVPPTLG
jgi:plasmid stabilization system protein ParE